MAIFKTKALILTLFLFSALTFAIRSPLPEASTSEDLSKLLITNGLPPGLFPDSVNGIQAENDGTLTITQEHDCYVRFPSGAFLHYQSLITGVIKPGIISKIVGVSMQRPTGWRAVTQIKHVLPQDNMAFSVGEISPVVLPMSDFAYVPTCQYRNDWTSKIRSVTGEEV